MIAALNAIGVWLVDFAVLASVLLALALALRLVIRQPASRVALAWGTWLGIALLAALTALPVWPRLPATALLRPAPSAVDEPTAESDLPADLIVFAPLEAAPAPSQPVAEPLPPAIRYELLLSEGTALAAIGWLGVGLLAVAWIGIGLVQTRRLVRKATNVPGWVHAEFDRLKGQASGGRKSPGNAALLANSTLPGGSRPPLAGRITRRAPRVLASERLSTAAALGALWPTILLPSESVREANAPAIRAALAHEWAHIRHGDLWLLLVERLLAPLLAAHPLFWWLRRSVRLDQEILADAAAAGDQPVEYAEALLAWAKAAQPTPVGLAALSLWESPQTLSRRVAMLLSPNRSTSAPPSRRWQAAIVAVLLLLVGGLSLVTLRPLAADDEPQAEAPESPAGFRVTAGEGLRVTVAEPPVPASGQSADNDRRAIKLDVFMATIDEEAYRELRIADLLQGDPHAKPATVAKPTVARSVLNTDQWEELRDKLQGNPRVSVFSRPKVVTLDGQKAHVQIGPPMEMKELRKLRDETTGRVNEAYEKLGTVLHARPDLIYPNPGAWASGVALDLSLELNELEPSEDDGSPPGIRSRMFRLESTVAFGQAVVFAATVHPQPSGPKKWLLVAVQPSPGEIEREIEGNTARAMKSGIQPMGDSLSSLPDGPEKERLTRAIQNLRKDLEAVYRDGAPLSEVSGQFNRLKAEVDALLKQHASADDVVKAPADAAAPWEEKLASSYNALQLKEAKLREEYFRLKKEQDALLAQWREVHEKLGGTEARRPEGFVPPTPAPVARPATGQPRFTVAFRFHHLPAERAMEAIKQALGAIDGVQVENIKIEPDKRTNTLIISADGELGETIQKIVKAIDRPASAAADDQQRAIERGVEYLRSNRAAGNDHGVSGLAQLADRQTQLKLLELERREAQLEQEVAAAEVQQMKEIRAKNPGAVSDTELRTSELKVERAHIRVQKIEVLLDALKQAEPQPAGQPLPRVTR